MQCSVRKGRRPKKQIKYEAENNPKYLTLLQAIKVALFRLLVVRCKTGLNLLPKTHPALLRFDEFSKTSVFPENLEKECCAQCPFKFWTTLWKLLTNITLMFYVPSGKGVIDSGQGPL